MTAPLYSLTVKRELATRYSVNETTRALSAARDAFPGHTLSVEADGQGRFLIASEGRVARWLRQ
jgi:DNA-binding transcriptional regulator/RsmH inhibitor MraZ